MVIGSRPPVSAIFIATAITFAACAGEPWTRISNVADIDRDASAAFPDGDVPAAPADLSTDIADAMSPDIADDTGEDIISDTEDITDIGPDTPPPGPCPFELIDEGLIGGAVNRIQFDPRVPGLAWLASSEGLMRSNDGGLTFEPRASEAPVNGIAFPAGDPKTLLTISNAGLASSGDAGFTLTPLALDGLRLTAVAASPIDPTRIWVGTDGGGVFRSDNTGTSFATTNVGIPYGQVHAIAASPASADIAIAGFTFRNDSNIIQNRGLLLRTTNAGRSWTTVSDDVVWGHQVVFCPSNPDRVFAAVRAGILASNDAGLTWTRLPFLANRDVLDVAVAAGNCDTVWAFVYQDAIYRIDLSLMALTGPLRTGIAMERVRFNGWLAAHPIEPAILLLATASGIFRTDNHGHTFHPIAGPRTLNILSVAGSLDGSGRLLLGTSGSGLFDKPPENPWIRAAYVERDLVANIRIDPFNSNRIMATSSNQTLFSTTGPEGLRPVATPINNFIHVIWRDSLGDILVSTQVSGVRRSRDGGLTFTAFNAGLTAWPTPNGTFIDIRWLLADPADPRRVIAATRGRGIAMLDPDTETWSLIVNDIAADEVWKLIQAGDLLYAMVSGKGIQQSADMGLTWRPMNDGLESTNTFDLVYDDVSDRLFVSGIANTIHELANASTLTASRARWRPIGGGCFDERTGFGTMAVHNPGDGTRELVVTGNRNRAWRLHLSE